MLTLQERFYTNLKFEGDCLVWTKLRDKRGYGITSVKRRRVFAHRMAAFLGGMISSIQPLPKEQWASQRVLVLHTCDNPACCRLSHLYVGNLSDNMLDINRRGRRTKRNTLSFAQAQELRREYSDGASYNTLADKYGVSVNVVYNIVQRKTKVSA